MLSYDFDLFKESVTIFLLTSLFCHRLLPTYWTFGATAYSWFLGDTKTFLWACKNSIWLLIKSSSKRSRMSSLFLVRIYSFLFDKSSVSWVLMASRAWCSDLFLFYDSWIFTYLLGFLEEVLTSDLEDFKVSLFRDWDPNFWYRRSEFLIAWLKGNILEGGLTR